MTTTTPNRSTDHQENLTKLRDLMKGITFAMLTTVDDDGTLHSRPMAMQDAEFDGDLWFFTGKSSPKVHEIRHDQHVNVAFAKPEDQRYVSVSGRARVVEDRAKMKQLWTPVYKAWFPDGLDDPDLALLNVTVDSAEYWDSPSSKVVQLVGFVKALATGKRAGDEAGENRTMNLR